MKEGYKETVIGIIPEDWEIMKLDHLASKVGSGITPRGGQESYLKSGIIFIRSHMMRKYKFT